MGTNNGQGNGQGNGRPAGDGYADDAAERAARAANGGGVTPAVAVQLVNAAVAVRPIPAATWTGGQVPADTTARQVAPASGERLQLRVTNAGASFVYLSPRQAECSPTIGYPLAPGASADLDAAGEAWAICAAGETSTVGVLSRFR